jgi:hypothetical protein
MRLCVLFFYKTINMQPAAFSHCTFAVAIEPFYIRSKILQLDNSPPALTLPDILMPELT